jgi:3-deoxy-manno-octulosonate cytidylyltransferase (CMP-KDO synthetase)
MQSRPRKAKHGSTSYVIIPARLRSTRLPRKLLLRETGKTILQHTYESASRATRPSGICVAADHPEIAREVIRFGGQVRMTDPEATSGTDRVAEVASQLTNVDIVVNVQGDEPELCGAAIDTAIDLLDADPNAVMSTLATPIRTRHELEDPGCVKVVFDDHGRALYFSRSPIPFVRDGNVDSHLKADPPIYFLHIGLYAYRRDFLLQLTRLPRPRLECLENLEQLRVLCAGYSIQVGTVEHAACGIDTSQDYAAFVARNRLRSSA